MEGFPAGTDSDMSKQESKQETKPQVSLGEDIRPIGLSISSFFYAASGIYYLAIPIILSDPTAWFLYVIGGLSLIGAFGVFKMTRWGLWLGLALFGPQAIVPGYVLLNQLTAPGTFGQAVSIAFVASLFVFLFFAALTFLLILDKRRSFK